MPNRTVALRLSLLLGLFFVVSAATTAWGEQSASKAKAQFQQPDAANLPDLFVYSDTCNVVVLRDGEAALLIDLGDGTVVDHLTDIGVRNVEWVLFTHHHREQCQGIGRLDRTKTKVAAPDAERALFETPREFRKWYPTLRDQYTVYGASYARPPRQPIRLDRTLEAGETFTWRGYELKCLATPGHSPGGMSYLLKREGQTAAMIGGVMHDGSKLTTWFDSEWDYGFAKGIDTLLESVDLLLAEKPTLALASQGPPIRHAAQQLAQYRQYLTLFRQHYVRGYPVFESTEQERDPISQQTPVPHINRVTPHLYKLSHKTKGRNFAIIVADSGRALVLDCGLFPEAMLEEIIVGMRAHLGLKQIDAFWISHMHGDHFLLGPVMKEKYGAKAWTLDSIVDKCEHPRWYDYSALIGTYPTGFDGMKIDKGFRDGESIVWEGYRIQVDWMPGQTEFGCCLWLDIDGKRVAFTGDNLFGSPADPKQDGHECVVAHNSAILEEGYLLGSRYLMELKPDIVMGSHSYVMPEPADFLARYHRWSQTMIEQFQAMLPEKDYEYLFDPYWVSAYPYRVDFSEHNVQEVTVTVRNFRNSLQAHRVELKLPTGVTADPAVLEGFVPRESRRRFHVTLTADREQLPPGVQLVPLDITLDGKHYGELFDFLIRAREAEPTKGKTP